MNSLRFLLTFLKLVALGILVIILFGIGLVYWKLGEAYLLSAKPLLGVDGATVITSDGKFVLYGLRKCKRSGRPEEVFVKSWTSKPVRVYLEKMPDGAYKGTLYYYHSSDIANFPNDSGWRSTDIARFLVFRGFALPSVNVLRNDPQYASSLIGNRSRLDRKDFEACDQRDWEETVQVINAL